MCKMVSDKKNYLAQHSEPTSLEVDPVIDSTKSLKSYTVFICMWSYYSLLFTSQDFMNIKIKNTRQQKLSSK